MPYDENLAARLRLLLQTHPRIEEKKMFGGVAFLIGGNMCCGIHRDNLIVRVGPERYEGSMALPNAGPMDITGRPMKGWVMVDPEGISTDDALRQWVEKGIAFAASLPDKKVVKK
jgi:TfoX/Sxy family transcriptional regulator of competence genes